MYLLISKYINMINAINEFICVLNVITCNYLYTIIESLTSNQLLSFINTGINQEMLDTILMTTDQCSTKEHYNVLVVESLIHIISKSCQNSKSNQNVNNKCLPAFQSLLVKLASESGIYLV